ncbi:hypothetical protein FIBSPDRAFT_860337 [Athelia psychrophila]|uniref:Uncharacterized protein n=1 Tax=Athelia psychrophila TaxID=1759441 RepID=A0A166KAZ7_9AGAM|nr:hypothetical protein FIBSPDRAFT_860337 [Fibularhizoctonia sp. CBS 109695]
MNRVRACILPAEHLAAHEHEAVGAQLSLSGIPSGANVTLPRHLAANLRRAPAYFMGVKRPLRHPTTSQSFKQDLGVNPGASATRSPESPHTHPRSPASPRSPREIRGLLRLKILDYPHTQLRRFSQWVFNKELAPTRPYDESYADIRQRPRGPPSEPAPARIGSADQYESTLVNEEDAGDDDDLWQTPMARDETAPTAQPPHAYVHHRPVTIHPNRAVPPIWHG